MKRPSPILLTLLGVLLCATALLTSCRAEECRTMQACCEAMSDVEGTGAACKGLADQTRDPTTCRSVVRTLRYMMEDRGQEIPEACQ